MLIDGDLWSKHTLNVEAPSGLLLQDCCPHILPSTSAVSPAATRSETLDICALRFLTSDSAVLHSFNAVFNVAVACTHKYIIQFTPPSTKPVLNTEEELESRVFAMHTREDALQ
jgi:hypothetical protein